MSKPSVSPAPGELPSLVDVFLFRSNGLKFAAMQVVVWHRRFHEPGAHLSDGALTVIEETTLHNLLVAVVKASDEYTVAHDNFVAARAAAAKGRRTVDQRSI